MLKGNGREFNKSKELISLAEAYLVKKDFANALETFKKALLSDIDNVSIYINIAKILILDRQEMMAKLYLEEAVKIDSKNDYAVMLLAEIYNRLGDSTKSIELYNKAHELNPKKEYLSSYIFVAHKDPRFTLKDFFDLALRVNNEFYSSYKPSYDHSSRKNSDKTKLKLGFVSADFKNHPVGNSYKKIFEKLDRNKFEIFLFDNYKENVQAAEKFPNLVNFYVSISNKKSKDIADLIYKLEIDILIDLSGYTAGERLEIFKLKPAPLQISHLGYFGTLGMQEMDYIFADSTVIKPGEENFFVEKIFRFKGTYAHCDLFENIDQIPEPPCSRSGFVTFGSMNNFHKINDEVIQVWSEILRNVKNSKLLIDSRFLINNQNYHFILEKFKKNSIDESVLIVRNSIDRNDFIRSYNLIDIALDPFPYTGGTSTIEALSMGVPLITLEGTNWVQRMSASHLRAINHEELITNNVEDYKSKIIDLASSEKRLTDYRKNLRQDMLRSPMNIDNFIKGYEDAMFDLWKECCAMS